MLDALLFSVSYSGSWGQETLGLEQFIERAAAALALLHMGKNLGRRRGRIEQQVGQLRVHSSAIVFGLFH